MPSGFWSDTNTAPTWSVDALGEHVAAGSLITGGVAPITFGTERVVEEQERTSAKTKCRLKLADQDCYFFTAAGDEAI